MDYGATWRRIDAGIPADHFTRVVRADPERAGLLYAGTERGMYLSFDDGASWSPFQQNLPIVPITDLAVKRGSLVAATQGRGFWMIKDLSPLHGFMGIPAETFALFPPRAASRAPGQPLRVHWVEPEQDEAPESRTLAILDGDGNVLRSYDGDALPSGPGYHSLSWNLRTEDIPDFPGMILWNSNLSGAKVPPGSYSLRLTIGAFEANVPVLVEANPSSKTPQADLEAQYEFLVETGKLLGEVHTQLGALRKSRSGLQDSMQRLPDSQDALRDQASTVIEAMDEVEKALYQTKNRSRQDPLNFPIRLNDKLAGLRQSVAVGDWAPTAQAQALRLELGEAIQTQLARWRSIVEDDLPALDEAFRAAALPYFEFPAPDPAEGAAEESQSPAVEENAGR